MNTPSETDPSSGQEAGIPRREGPEEVGRKRRRWPWILLILFVLFALAVVFLVPPVAGPVVKGLIVDAGAEQGFTVTVASCSFSWQSGLEIREISARENLPHGIQARVKSLVVAPRWSGLLRGILALGRFRVEEPHIVLDPARKPPEKPDSSPSSTPGKKGGAAGEKTGEKWNIDLPLNVTGGHVEVLASGEKPGFRLENLTVNGHLYGLESRVNGTVLGDLVAGNRREPLRLSGDITLGRGGKKSSGAAMVQVGGVDLACLAPFINKQGSILLERGILRGEGEIKPEGTGLKLKTGFRIVDLRLVDAKDPSRVLEEPEVKLAVEALVEPQPSRLHITKGALTGAPVAVDFKGVVSKGAELSAELEIGIRGILQRFHAFLPDMNRVSGNMQGTFKVALQQKEAVVGGGMNLTDLQFRMPADENAPGSRETVVREAKVHIDVDMKALLAGADSNGVQDLEGVVKVKGGALALDAHIRSGGLPDLSVSGKVNGKTAKVLEQLGMTLPVDLVASGDFETTYTASMKPGKEGGKSEVNGTFQLSGPSIRRAGINLDNIRVKGNLSGDRFRFAEVKADLNGGTVSVRGDLDMAGKGGRFSLDFDASGIQITQSIASFLKYVVPLYHIPEGLDGQVGGGLSGKFTLAGPFPPSTDMDLKALKGGGSVSVDRGFVEGSPLVGQILQGFGKKTSYEFKNLNTSFHLTDSTVFHDSFQARGRELAWGFKGTTKLDTSIDYSLDPGPLVERIFRKKESRRKLKRWERVLRDVAKGVKSLPVSLGGTLDSPKLKFDPGALPGLGSGPDPVNKLLEGILGGKKKKKRK